MSGRLILGIANPALDANGEVDADATLTYWENLTTTPQGIFADHGLQTPLTNPLSCDAAGRFPMVWAPDGTVYTIKWTPSAEAPITYDNITPTTDVYDTLQAMGVFNLSLTVDGAGADLTTGVCGDDYVPFDCTVTKYTIQCIETGSIEIDVWVDDYSNSSKPTVANTIVASAPVTLSSAKNNQDTTLTGWTKAIAADSAIRYNINSNTGIKHFTLNLTCTRTA